VDALQAIVLGIVQGLTEFLPISSTAHLRIVPALLGWQDPGTAFTAVVQLGTMLAVLVYFWNDLWSIAKAWLRSLRDPALRGTLDARMGWFLIIGTIPVSVIGLALKDPIEHQFRSLELIGAALVVMGLVLGRAESAATETREVADLTRRDAWIIGFAQAGALIPGVSRSGATITAARGLGFDRESAATFSFMMSTPIIAAAALLKVPKALAQSGVTLSLTVAVLTAAVSSAFAITVLLRYVKHRGLGVFAIYRIVLGAAVLALVAYRAH
jgi:undecaprenyl-diphosphatase